MKVGIDATELAGGGVGGVRTGLRLLLEALRDHAPGVDAFALAPRPVAVPPGVRLLATGGPARPRAWRRSRALRRAAAGLDVFHSPVTATPPSFGPALTATVHELPFCADPRLEPPLRSLAQQVRLAQAMARGARLVAPSRATVEQLRTAHPAAAAEARVVPHPCPPVAPGPLSCDGSILFVGRLEPRKCVGAVFAAATRVAGDLLLAGPQPPRARRRLEEAARAAGVLSRVRFLGVVDDARLDALYRAARVVVLPSASEGFGFPVLEALARGVPVVVAEGTGAAETGGEQAIAVRVRSAERLADALALAGSDGHRARIAVEGPARAASFSPERTAAGYAALFSDAASR